MKILTFALCFDFPTLPDGWFSLSKWGNVTIDGEGNMTFAASPNGNCQYHRSLWPYPKVALFTGAEKVKIS